MLVPAQSRLEVGDALHGHGMGGVLPLSGMLGARPGGKHAGAEDHEGVVEVGLKRAGRMSVDRLKGIRVCNRDKLGGQANDRPYVVSVT